jgi:hypothetical protein
MIKYWLIATTGLVMLAGVAAAQGPFPQSPSKDAFSDVPRPPGVGSFTSPSGGPANISALGTTTAPGGGVGVLMDNGNGTSTLVGPDGGQRVLATPQ